MQNPVLIDTIQKLKVASKSNNVKIWLAVARMLERSRSRRVEVNIDRIARYTKDGSKVVVPGKVLAKGNIDHKIELAAFAISEAAARKIKEAGGMILTLEEMANKYPDGKEVMIIG
ncbi:MAG: 50S ribosomal protein L18e [Candidatus Nitrosocaldaceae archaeon]|nr:MAG: 50S ribosomal protein L18e [Candidatus Nitrosocaldaceae archaeon]GIU72136.1 MAG: 50S ribosomal protein L18e [Candidatus Nitrosocaldaceae archaeon]